MNRSLTIVPKQEIERAHDILLERPLPSSPDAERAIEGAIILDNAVFWQAIEFGVTPEWFYIPAHRRIFEAMDILANRGSEINPILIGEELKRLGMLTAVGGITFITNLTYGLPHFANIAHYAKIVRDKFYLRTLAKVCTRVISRVLEEDEEAEVILTEAESAILEFVGTALRGHGRARAIDAVHISTDKLEFIQTLEKRAAGISDAIPTGIKPIDDKLEGGGFNPQGFYLIAAEPKSGKTSLALDIASRTARRFGEQGIPKSVAVFSLEMRRLALEMRMFSGYTGISFDTLSRPGKLRGVEMELAFASIDGFFNFPLYISDAVFALPELWRACERMVYGPMQAGLILVDYLQLLSLRKGQMLDPEHLTGEVTLVSRELKHIAQELNVPLAGISSVNRLGELRQSGQMDYDVEALIKLENPEWAKIKKYMQDKKSDEGIVLAMRAELDSRPVWDINARLAYQRNGPTGDNMLKFLRRYMQFLTPEEYERMNGGPTKGTDLDLGTLWEQSK